MVRCNAIYITTGYITSSSEIQLTAVVKATMNNAEGKLKLILGLQIALLARLRRSNKAMHVIPMTAAVTFTSCK